MGRKTFDSLGRKCLPNRHNIVISHSFGLFPETADCKAACGIEDALFRATLAQRGRPEVFVIGGASMYEQFTPYADRYLVTMVEKDVPEGDTFFNQEPLGDPDRWIVSPLFSCPAGENDEASFTVFEALAKNPDQFALRRTAAIETARKAATADASPHKARSRARTQESALRPSYSLL
jgi:dihydrofolate reductase